MNCFYPHYDPPVTPFFVGQFMLNSEAWLVKSSFSMVKSVKSVKSSGWWFGPWNFMTFQKQLGISSSQVTNKIHGQLPMVKSPVTGGVALPGQVPRARCRSVGRCDPALGCQVHPWPWPWSVLSLISDHWSLTIFLFNTWVQYWFTRPWCIRGVPWSVLVSLRLT